MKRSLAAAASRTALRRSRDRLAGVEPRLRLAAALDDLGQLALFLSGQQRNQADLVQVLTDGITHGESPQRELLGCHSRIPIELDTAAVPKMDFAPRVQD